MRSRSKVVDGLLYPDWESVHDWLEEHVDLESLDANELWGDIATDWFSQNALELGEEFQLRRSPNFLLLHDVSAREGDLLLSHCERVFVQVRDFLGSAAYLVGVGPIGILQATAPFDVYRYPSIFTSCRRRRPP